MNVSHRVFCALGLALGSALGPQSLAQNAVVDWHAVMESSVASTGRKNVVAYLERFARQHGVALRLRTQLLEVQREHDVWRLETSSGRMLCRYLVIASGWDAVPCMPRWPGATTFDNELIH